MNRSDEYRSFICRWEGGIYQEKTVFQEKSWQRPVSFFVKEVYSPHPD
jgi:hypothetical protein